MQLMTYVTDDGEEVTIQVADTQPSSEMVTRGWGGSTGEVVTRAEQGFDGALSHIQPAIRSLVSQLRSNVEGPDEFQVEFGIQLSAGVGAFISAGTTANFRVVMTWRGRDRA